MFETHGFSVGLPDNLVHLPRLLDILRIKLDYLQCFYCEHVFKSAKVLKEHMRKKKHWRIPQSRPLYDQFYLVTYSTSNVNDVQRDVMEEDGGDEETEDWQDWNEEGSDSECDMAKCIYCPTQWRYPEQCFDHMQKEHGFDFFGLKQHLSLTSYQCIAWINYSRKCVSNLVCTFCGNPYESRDQLLEHQKSAQHFCPPLDSSLLSDPSYVTIS